MKNSIKKKCVSTCPAFHSGYCAKYRVTILADMDNWCIDPVDTEIKEAKATVLKELRMLIGDYFLAGALRMYPKGAERESLACYLSSHFKLVSSYRNKK